MSQRILMDDDGENRAVRCFLSLYSGTTGVTVAQMTSHLAHSGFDGYWPEWVNDPAAAGHLTKGGAQHWIRHLFSIEPDPAAQTQIAAVARLRGIVETLRGIVADMDDDHDRKQVLALLPMFDQCFADLRCTPASSPTGQ